MGSESAPKRGDSIIPLTLSVRFTVQGPPALSVADAAANESDGSIAFAVTLDRAAPGTVTVAYETRDGSAKGGHDYTAATGTLSFAAGETSKRHDAGGSASSLEPGPFRIRIRTKAGLEAGRFELLAWASP